VIPKRFTNSRSSNRSPPQLRVQVAERLVEQQDARFSDDCPSEREALLLPPLRNGAGRSAKPSLDECQYVFNFVGESVAGKLAFHFAQREGDVFKNIQMRPNGVGLKHHADVAIVGRHEGFRGEE